MVRLCCDRCGNEITDRYYTININSYDVIPEFCFGHTEACSVPEYSNTREDILRRLNSTKMYCKYCKDKIERFVNTTEEWRG